MTDNRDNRGRPPRKPGGKGFTRRGPEGGEKRSGPRRDGDRPVRAREGDAAEKKPFRPREDRKAGDRPFKPREDRVGGGRPFKPREDRAGGDRPFKPREDRAGGGRPFKPREDRAGGDRPFKPREDRTGGGRSFKPRQDRAGGERPFKPREDRADGGRPFKPREGRAGGDRPFKPREDRAPRGERREFTGDRPPRRAVAEGAARRDRDDAGGFRPRLDAERPEEKFGDRPLARRSGPDRGEKRFDRKPQRERAPRPALVEREDGAQRIAKVIARAGLCSRRDAEVWIEAGRVVVNGETLASPAFNVKPGDQILVDGQPLAEKERTRLFLFNKPRGYVTTDRDPEGRPTIFEAMPEGLPRLVTVGRLDINTEGLLLLTNDGGLARILELPATGWLRRYRVRAKGTTDQAVLDSLRAGVTVEGIEYRGVEAKLDREQGSNIWLTVGLREGKNREVKRVLEHIGLEVNRLIRISFGPFQLGELADGAVEEVPTRILRDQLGPTLAEEAGVDLDGPIAPAERSERPRRDDSDRAPRGERPARGERPDRGERVSRGDAPRGRGRFQREPEEEQRPRVDRPKPGPRKHVSVLRAEKEDRTGPRKRIERAETADRKGRAVKVERVIAPEPKDVGSRNARRFAQERDGGERVARTAGAPGGQRGRGRERTTEREDFRGPRPERRGGGERDTRGFKPRRDDEAGVRTARPEGRGFKGGDRPPARGDGPPPRGGRGPFRGDRPRPEGDRPRTGGDRPRTGGDRPRTGGDRPKTGGGKPRFDKDRAPRDDGGRPRGPGKPRGGPRDKR